MKHVKNVGPNVEKIEQLIELLLKPLRKKQLSKQGSKLCVKRKLLLRLLLKSVKLIVYKDVSIELKKTTVDNIKIGTIALP